MLNIYYYKGFNLLKTHYKKFFIAPSARLLQTNLISEIKIFYKKINLNVSFIAAILK